MPPELLPRLAELDRELYALQGLQAVELRLPDARGSQRDVLVTRSLHHDAAGRALGVVGTFLDITTRKKTEAALSESREKYRVMFQSCPWPWPSPTRSRGSWRSTAPWRSCTAAPARSW